MRYLWPNETAGVLKLEKLILIEIDGEVLKSLKKHFSSLVVHSINGLPSQVENQIYLVKKSEYIEPLYRQGAKGVYLFDNNEAQIIEELKAFFCASQGLQEHFYTKDLDYLHELEDCLKYGRNTNLPLLLIGESGTGKTHLAKAVHKAIRPDKPFINLNLLELNPNLLESELFGHQRGAFTGARENKTGLLEKANGGTLFLDEIGALPLETQAKLLKVIEEKRFSPVGSNEYKEVEFSLITATCQDLETMIDKGEFREDFYFRLTGHITRLKPLKERKEDILFFLQHFQKNYSRRLYFTEAFKAQVKDYDWPGNIRELNQLYHKLQCEPSAVVHELVDLRSSKEELQINLPNAIEELEKEIFQKAYRHYQGKTNKICQSLKISKSVFYRLQDSLLNETQDGLTLTPGCGSPFIS